MHCCFHSSVFCHLFARQLLPMGALSPRRRRCSIALQKAFRVLAAMFFYGLILWHRGTIRFASSASFCPLFLARQKKWVCEATVAVLPQIRHSGANRTDGRTESPAPTACCADLPAERQPRCKRKKDRGGETPRPDPSAGQAAMRCLNVPTARTAWRLR